MRRDWSELYLVRDVLWRASDGDVDTAEEQIGAVLPDGYRSLLTKLGDGTLGGLLRVFPPQEVVDRQAEYRSRMQEFWFWEPDPEIGAEQARESIVVADSIDGDEVIFHPVTRRLYVLPRHAETVAHVGRDLWDVVSWFQDSGELVDPHPFRYFEPSGHQGEAVNGSGGPAGFEELADAVRALGLHDAEEITGDDATFFVKAIGGLVTAASYGSPEVRLHLRYVTDLAPELRTEIRECLGALGVTFTPPWSMSG